MKKVMIFAVIVALASCNTATVETAAPAERTIGFNTMLPELKWHIGTEGAVTIVKEIDKLWAARKYDDMKQFISDTAMCYFEDGRIAKSAGEFVELLKAENLTSEDTWTFDYAYSVDLDPTKGGEHVQAGFTGTGVKDGVETKKSYHESYYIIDGKVVMWRQYSMAIK